MSKEINRALYLNKLINSKENGLVKVITGIRRCGKSYLLFKLFNNYLLDNEVKESNIIKINLEELENQKYHDRDLLNEYIKSQIKSDKEFYYVFIDEIQNVNGFEPLLNSLNNKNNVDVYVTGSNSKFLSTDILTEFRGRAYEIKVHPLSFREFYMIDKKEIDKSLEEYMMYGGLPFIINLKKEDEKVSYLKSLFEKVYFADVIEKNNIRKDDLLDEIVNCLASTIGSLTNANNVANTFKSKGLINTEYNTVSNYIEYLENSFMINKATRYNVRGRQYIQTPYKYYFEDIGLRNARLNFRQYDKEHIMENIIYNELISRGYNVDVGIVEKYVNNKDNKTIRKTFEVDFVCNLGSKRYYVQSAYSLDSEAKIIQEKNSLININDSFKKIIIVNDNTIPYYDDNGIKTMNLKEFLIDVDSLEK